MTDRREMSIGKEETGTPPGPQSPSHHARRPMNAFLIFCKKHRPIARAKYPSLENRGVTRILGEWWALLEADDKEPYTRLAKEYKDAFFSANPNFKWYKLPAPPLRTLPTRPAHIKTVTVAETAVSCQTVAATAEFTPGKLADESQLGMLSSLLNAAGRTFGSNRPEPERVIEEEFCNNNDRVENNNVEDEFSMNGLNDRKPDRKCKGIKYAEFMTNGRLIKNKRERDRDVRYDVNDLTSTIKRLEERILPKPDEEVSEETTKSMPSFNLDRRIAELPSLSYEAYAQRKRESKKRKFKVKNNNAEMKIAKVDVKRGGGGGGGELTGSKKRKNKLNITHLEKNDEIETSFTPGTLQEDDLSGLATLATIAAFKEKISGGLDT